MQSKRRWGIPRIVAAVGIPLGLIGGILSALIAVSPASAAASMSESPSSPAAWAANVPYGASNAPSGITLTVSSCTAGSGVTATSGPSSGPGLQISGTNAADLLVLSYGSGNTAASSTVTLGANPAHFLPSGSSTFTFSAYSGGTLCVTSATYTITITTEVATLTNLNGTTANIFDDSYYEANFQTYDVVDADTVNAGTFSISSQSPGTGFSCTAAGAGSFPVAATAPTPYNHVCSLQASPGSGDDNNVMGASSSTANAVSVREVDSTGTTTTAYTIDVFNVPLCAVAPDGAGQSITTGVTGTPNTHYANDTGTSNAIEVAASTSGPSGGLITGVQAGQQIFSGCNPLYTGPGFSGLNLSIEANPFGDVVTNPSTNAENDYDQGAGEAGLSSAGWTFGLGFTVGGVTLTSGSKTATVASGGFPNVVTGMGVSGNGIQTGTTVSAYTTGTNTLTLSLAASANESNDTLTFNNPTVTNGSATVTVPAGGFKNYSGDGSGGGDTNVAAGMGVTGTGIPACDFVKTYTAGSNSLTLNAAFSGTTGPEKLTFGASCTAPPPMAPTATTTVPNPFTISSNMALTGQPGDTNATCPPTPAQIDAGLPFCEEWLQNAGAAPTYGVAFVKYSGQALPNAPTLALSSNTGVAGNAITITDAANQCPSSLTVAQFSNTYDCWYGRANLATPVTATVGGVSATVTPTNVNAGDVSKASYTYPGFTFSSATLSPPQLNASFTIPSNAPLGVDPVQVCEPTAQPDGNNFGKVCSSSRLRSAPPAR